MYISFLNNCKFKKKHKTVIKVNKIKIKQHLRCRSFFIDPFYDSYTYAYKQCM